MESYTFRSLQKWLTDSYEVEKVSVHWVGWLIELGSGLVEWEGKGMRSGGWRSRSQSEGGNSKETVNWRSLRLIAL